MAPTAKCPDTKQFVRYLRGQLSKTESEDLTRHLEGCRRCSELLPTITTQDSFIPIAPKPSGLSGPAAAPPKPPAAKSGTPKAPPATGSSVSARGDTTAAPQTQERGAPEVDEYSFLSPALQPEEMGRFGGYRVLELIGSGGMGYVFKAEDTSLHRLVALKVLRPALAADPVVRKRFALEARGIAALNNDHIVTVFQVGEDRGVPFIAMELLRGESLEAWLKHGRTPSVLQILRIGREIAKGLAAAHDRGVIHRDIKPANIWLESPTGRVKILDFGLARLMLGESTGGGSGLTMQGDILGTPSYMAPEQADGAEVDHRCDLYSLGSVLYRLATGTPPFHGPSPMMIFKAIATETPTPPAELAPHLPPAVCALIETLIARHRDDRPASAKAVIDRIGVIYRGLAPAASGQAPAVSGVSPAPLGLPVNLPPPARGGRGRSRLVWTLAATNLLSLTGLGILAFQSRGSRGGIDGKDDAAWAAAVAPLPGDKQFDAVVARLRARNPGFDGPIVPRLAGEEVVGLVLPGERLTDLGPLRALPQLSWLSCAATGPGVSRLTDLTPLWGSHLTALDLGNTQVADLTPISDLRLTAFDCSGTQVSDLTALKSMPLKRLSLVGTRVTDLYPLEGMPLTVLVCTDSRIADLLPLRKMPLVTLHCGGTAVSDLSPLRGAPLTRLHCQHTRVMSLAPLVGMPLVAVSCQDTRVTDLSPLLGAPLDTLECDYVPERDAPVLRKIPTLRVLNGRPAAEVLKESPPGR